MAPGGAAPDGSRSSNRRPAPRPRPRLRFASSLLLLLALAATTAAAPSGAAPAFVPSPHRPPPTRTRRPLPQPRPRVWGLVRPQPSTLAAPPAAAVATVPPEPGQAGAGAGGEEEGEDAWLPRAVYVHLPFCRRRCYYCDFPIKVVGDRPGAADAASEEYVGLLLRELEATISPTPSSGRGATSDEGPSSSSSSLPSSIDPARIRAAGGLTSIFFGGGTPSLTPPHLVRRVIAALEAAFGLSPDAEISMEMDPGTFDLPRLQSFLGECGVTRVSMGVQAFDAGLLAACGRAHSLEDVHAAVAALRDAGFENYSVDLIGGLPGQTLAQWEHSLDAAVASGAAHVSVYDLQVEASTAFGRWYGAEEEDEDTSSTASPPKPPSPPPPQQQPPTSTTSNRSSSQGPKNSRLLPHAPLPREELAAAMYARASAKLRSAGFTHYELSNYAKPGHECRHNRVYWEGEPFLALGMGAASYVGWHRFARPRSMGEYRLWVALLEDRGWAAASGYAEARTGWPAGQWAVERLEDLLMVGLRLREGVSLPGVIARAGLAAAVGAEKAGAVLAEWEGAVVPRFVERGAAVYSGGEGGRLVLVDPEGLLVSNEAISELYAAVGRVLEGG